MNVAAYLSFDPANPTASRFVDEDFNRLWTAEVLDNPERKSAELTRARTVRPYIGTVDLLLDIHSMQRKQPAMMMAGPLAKGRELAKAVGRSEEHTSELQSLMRNSYAVFCLKKKKRHSINAQKHKT